MTVSRRNKVFENCVTVTNIRTKFLLGQQYQFTIRVAQIFFKVELQPASKIVERNEITLALPVYGGNIR